jgi:dipeptidase
MTWQVDSLTYVHERAVSTQQTGFSFVTQSRSWLPGPVGGVFWFGVDDTYSTVYNPIYCGIDRVPRSFAVGNGDFHNFTWDSGFWVFNWVSNFAYSRYSDMIRDIRIVQRDLEGSFIAGQDGIDQAASALYKQSPRLAVDYLTDYSCRTADATVARWRKLGEDLLVKYMDGNLKDEMGHVQHPSYPESWYRAIVDDAGDRLLYRELEKKE